MARLLFTKPNSEDLAIELTDGVYRLGCAPDNDVHLDDESVSEYHCEFQVTPQGVWVRDLGSATGTFVNDEPITETWLRPGQTLRLGSVSVRFARPGEGSPATPAQSTRATGAAIRLPPSDPTATTAPVPDSCPNHPAKEAEFICCSCTQLCCADCVKSFRAGMRIFHSCPACGKSVVPLEEYRRQIAFSEVSFFQLFPGAFLYPLRHTGTLILVSGAIFFSLLHWAQNIARYALIFGLLAIVILTIMSGGYLFAFMKGIATDAASGEDNPPRWPDSTSFQDTFLSPFFQLLVILLLCLAPGAIAYKYAPLYAALPLLFAGVFCLPMALLRVSLADSVTGLNPMFIVSWIVKLPGPYLAIFGVFVFTLGLVLGIDYLLEASGLGLFGVPLLHFVNLYSVAVQMRLLGFLYLTGKERLAAA